MKFRIIWVILLAFSTSVFAVSDRDLREMYYKKEYHSVLNSIKAQDRNPQHVMLKTLSLISLKNFDSAKDQYAKLHPKDRPDHYDAVIRLLIDQNRPFDQAQFDRLFAQLPSSPTPQYGFDIWLTYLGRQIQIKDVHSSRYLVSKFSVSQIPNAFRPLYFTHLISLDALVGGGMLSQPEVYPLILAYPGQLPVDRLLTLVTKTDDQLKVLSQVIARKEVEKATTLIGRMARYLGVNPDFNLIAGKGFFEFKQYDQASEYLGKISKKTAQYPEAQFYLARIDYRQTRFQEGYARLSTLNPPQFSATAIYPQLLDLWMEFYQKVATSSLTVTDFVSAHDISQEALPNVFLSKLGVEAYHYGQHDIAFDYFFKWAPTTPLDHAKRFYFLHRTEVGLNKTPLSGYDGRCFYDYPDTIYASFLSGDRPEFNFKTLIDSGYEISIDPTAAQKKWVEWGLGMYVIDDLNARISQRPRSEAKADVLVGAWIYQQLGMFQPAMQQLLRNGVTLYDKERGLCTTLLPYFYPKPYWPHLEKEAEARKIDPNFALAIMREESLFNPRATSKSGAMGLMQLMPATAKGIAKSVGNKGFEVSDLYAPQTNIQFGSYYLGFLSTKFSAHPMWMAAGYNAGPNAAQRWKDRWLEMPQDVMIEQIPFAETNAYAKRVLRSFWIYSSLPL